uniref:Cytochrome c oxidase copper chaperone n=1 Tax=Oryza meridionalis TaxID=40149 RepID=A0A0E0ESA7_9ORYZ
MMASISASTAARRSISPTVSAFRSWTDGQDRTARGSLPFLLLSSGTLSRAAAAAAVVVSARPPLPPGARDPMGNTASGATEASDSTEKTEQAPPADTKPKKKICCACPDTKKLRDECIVQHGEDACRKWIEAHRQCLRAEEDCLKVPYYRLMHASSNSIAIVSEY